MHAAHWCVCVGYRGRYYKESLLLLPKTAKTKQKFFTSHLQSYKDFSTVQFSKFSTENVYQYIQHESFT